MGKIIIITLGIFSLFAIEKSNTSPTLQNVTKQLPLEFGNSTTKFPGCEKSGGTHQCKITCDNGFKGSCTHKFQSNDWSCKWVDSYGRLGYAEGSTSSPCTW